jgi:hypothetical protein
MKMEDHLSNWSGDRLLIFNQMSEELRGQADRALAQACANLPKVLDHHDSYRFIACAIIDRARCDGADQLSLLASAITALSQLKERCPVHTEPSEPGALS